MFIVDINKKESNLDAGFRTVLDLFFDVFGEYPMHSSECLSLPKVPEDCARSQALLAMRTSEGRAHFELARGRLGETQFSDESKKMGLMSSLMIHLSESLEAIGNVRSAIDAHERNMSVHGRTKAGLVKAIDLHPRGVVFHAAEILEFTHWNTLSEITQRKGYASVLHELETRAAKLETMTQDLIESKLSLPSRDFHHTLSIQFMQLSGKWNAFQGLATAACLLSGEMFSTHESSLS